MQPGHSIGPRKLRNAGALTCVINPYLLGFYSNCISSKTMASQKLGNQCNLVVPFVG